MTVWLLMKQRPLGLAACFAFLGFLRLVPAEVIGLADLAVALYLLKS